MLACELNGRSYGGGVLKLETREAESIIVPRVTAKMSSLLLESADAIDLNLS
jgi:hypothetical protein